MAKKIIVIGGGISGLTVAWHLSRLLGPSGQVTVLEQRDRPGGTAWTENRDGYLLETGPNGFLDNKPSTLALCESLGLGDRLIRANETSANRFIFLRDQFPGAPTLGELLRSIFLKERLHKVPASPGEFLRSNLLSWRGKLRVLLERFVRRGAPGTDESIYDFGCRRIGREATEVFLEALVSGIFAGDPTLLSLPACFPRMAELEQEYGSLILAQMLIAKSQRTKAESQKPKANFTGPGGTLTAPQGGMRTLIEALAESLAPNLHLGVDIFNLWRSPDGRWLVHSKGGSWSANLVILAAPAYEQARILAHLDPDLAHLVGEIPYSSAVVCVVGFRREDLDAELAGFGYLTPVRLVGEVLGVLWSSSIFPDQAPPGFFAFRAILGGWYRRDVVTFDDDSIVRCVLEDLRRSMGISAQPAFTWIHRWEKAIPQYHIAYRSLNPLKLPHCAHLKRLGLIEEQLSKHPGLFLTGNCFKGVSLNDCTEQAEKVAIRAARYLANAECGLRSAEWKNE